MDNYNTDDYSYRDGGYYDVKTGTFIPGDLKGSYEFSLDTNIANWDIKSPFHAYSSKKWVTDKVYTKWEVYWDNSAFDGTISNFAPRD